MIDAALQHRRSIPFPCASTSQTKLIRSPMHGPHLPLGISTIHVHQGYASIYVYLRQNGKLIPLATMLPVDGDKRFLHIYTK